MPGRSKYQQWTTFAAALINPVSENLNNPSMTPTWVSNLNLVTVLGNYLYINGGELAQFVNGKPDIQEVRPCK